MTSSISSSTTTTYVARANCPCGWEAPTPADQHGPEAVVVLRIAAKRHLAEGKPDCEPVVTYGTLFEDRYGE